MSSCVLLLVDFEAKILVQQDFQPATASRIYVFVFDTVVRAGRKLDAINLIHVLEITIRQEQEDAELRFDAPEIRYR